MVDTELGDRGLLQYEETLFFVLDEESARGFDRARARSTWAGTRLRDARFGERGIPCSMIVAQPGKKSAELILYAAPLGSWEHVHFDAVKPGSLPDRAK